MQQQTLYNITDDYLTVMEMLYDPEQDQQVIQDTLEGIMGEIEYKADEIAKIIKEIKADADKIKAEEMRLHSRRSLLEGKAAWLKDYLQANMEAIGVKKFKTELFSYNIQKNGGKQALTIDVEDVNDIPKEFLIPQDPIPNNDAIRTLLKTDKVAWAHLEPRGESLRIR